jgi:hypothetical protein
VERARRSGLSWKMGRVWQLMRSGQIGALSRGILAQLRRRS